MIAVFLFQAYPAGAGDKKDLDDMGHSYCSLHVHVVFGTEHRKCMLNATLRERLHPYLGGILRNLGCTPLIVGGTDDHVHLLVTVRADLAVADMVRMVKSNASKWIHEISPLHGTFAWQEGYGAFSVSMSNVTQVREYIQNQDLHHRTMTFEQELQALLEKHGFGREEEKEE